MNIRREVAGPAYGQNTFRSSVDKRFGRVQADSTAFQKQTEAQSLPTALRGIIKQSDVYISLCTAVIWRIRLYYHFYAQLFAPL